LEWSVLGEHGDRGEVRVEWVEERIGGAVKEGTSGGEKGDNDYDGGSTLVARFIEGFHAAVNHVRKVVGLTEGGDDEEVCLLLLGKVCCVGLQFFGKGGLGNGGGEVEV
jgi:hypothetical protein